MQSSIAIHVTAISNDNAKIEREMQALSNRMDIPVTALVDGKIICKMPDTRAHEMPEFFKDIFK